ncbi:hypothetical protein DFP72DRAFT_850695 [Ephemerocybe angulata]|uniref:Uncharacterized protein n=1 Tax=Ephemerocybe angulata TaxID=980116 RepID=A0A8H6HTM8_9AGAR|nr:hypothetical protein DFP72DRAFT_850695 [Tulosesus angulatus]
MSVKIAGDYYKPHELLISDAQINVIQARMGKVLNLDTHENILFADAGNFPNPTKQVRSQVHPKFAIFDLGKKLRNIGESGHFADLLEDQRRSIEDIKTIYEQWSEIPGHQDYDHQNEIPIAEASEPLEGDSNADDFDDMQHDPDYIVYTSDLVHRLSAYKQCG